MKFNIFQQLNSYSKNILAISVPLSLLLFSGCQKPVDNTRRLNAADLYQKSVMLIKLYSDSFSNASDSATLLELNDRFSSALTSLNFKYPSETCLEISEGENDTLTNLTEKIISIRDSLLYLYAHPIVPDSLSTDSLQVAEIKDSVKPVGRIKGKLKK